MSFNNQQMSPSAAIVPKTDKENNRSTSGPDPKKPRVQATPAVASSGDDIAPLILPEIHLCHHDMIRAIVTTLSNETRQKLFFKESLKKANDDKANLNSEIKLLRDKNLKDEEEISQLRKKIAELEKQLNSYKNDDKNMETPSPVLDFEKADSVASLPVNPEALGDGQDG